MKVRVRNVRRAAGFMCLAAIGTAGWPVLAANAATSRPAAAPTVPRSAAPTLPRSTAVAAAVAVPASGSADIRTRNLIDAAMTQIGRTTIYDPSYVRLSYPGGDVPLERGVCTDVLVRAFRAIGVDLQVAVHEDMHRHFSKYPRSGRSTPDANIDHRRVKNLSVFFSRQGAAVPVTQRPTDYRPGDIVTWDVDGLAHTGLVGEAFAPDTDRHLIIHNIGAGTQLEDILFGFPITGHFRYLTT